MGHGKIEQRQVEQRAQILQQQRITLPLLLKVVYSIMNAHYSHISCR